MARKLNLTVEDLPGARLSMAQTLRNIESADEALRLADAKAAAARSAYLAAASDLTAARIKAGQALALAVEAELAPLKLDKARFRVAVEPLAEDRCGPAGADRIEFEVMTNPGAPFGGLGVIASGGELSRFLLALKVCLTGDAPGLTLIFDEIDRGVGGATADAVGRRLKALATGAQVLVVTHSPQVAALGAHHWRVEKRVVADMTTSTVTPLDGAARIEEIGRMLSGDSVSDAAREAARALLAG